MSLLIRLIEGFAMPTKLLYLENPYLKSLPAVLTTVEAEGPCSWKVQFDQTIFYPMGGGQPTDQGIVSYPDGTSGEVYQVLCKEGKVFHYVRQACPPRVGESILQTLNWERRFRHMRVHSAGHVIDFALYRLGYSPYPLVPLKGDHGKKPSILYQGHVQDSFQARLQEETQNLIAQNLRFSWSFEPLERLQKEALYLQPGLPIHKPLRALHLEGVGLVADGGTIVSQTGEVGRVMIKAIEQKDQNTQIYYQVNDE